MDRAVYLACLSRAGHWCLSQQSGVISLSDKRPQARLWNESTALVVHPLPLPQTPSPWQLIIILAQGRQQSLTACQQHSPKSKGNLEGKQVIKQFYFPNSQLSYNSSKWYLGLLKLLSCRARGFDEVYNFSLKAKNVIMKTSWTEKQCCQLFPGKIKDHLKVKRLWTKETPN